MKRHLRLALLILALLGGAVLYRYPIVIDWIYYRFSPKKSVSDVMKTYQSSVGSRLSPLFLKKGLTFPPQNIWLVFLKDQKSLSIYSENNAGVPILIKTYEVLAESGVSGPKLANGDHQIPEGIYNIESLNPNSLYHLSLRLNYPNNFDKQMASRDGRRNLGSDIMIHGKDLSIGCIAIGDPAIEEVFVLAGLTNFRKWKVILAPNDLRKSQRTVRPSSVDWLGELDSALLEHLNKLSE